MAVNFNGSVTFHDHSKMIVNNNSNEKTFNEIIKCAEEIQKNPANDTEKTLAKTVLNYSKNKDRNGLKTFISNFASDVLTSTASTALIELIKSL